jgi:hypothetical protein
VEWCDYHMSVNLIKTTKLWWSSFKRRQLYTLVRSLLLTHWIPKQPANLIILSTAVCENLTCSIPDLAPAPKPDTYSIMDLSLRTISPFPSQPTTINLFQAVAGADAAVNDDWVWLSMTLRGPGAKTGVDKQTNNAKPTHEAANWW